MASDRMRLECPSRSQVEKVLTTSLINAIGGERSDFESHNIGSDSGKFRVMSWTVLLENSSNKNLCVLIQFFIQNRVVSQADLLETHPIINFGILGHATGRITGKLIQNKAFSRTIIFHKFWWRQLSPGASMDRINTK